MGDRSDSATRGGGGNPWIDNEGKEGSGGEVFRSNIETHVFLPSY